MRLMIESTDKFAFLNGVRCRIWEGTTEGGVPCKVLVCAIGVRTDVDASEFEQGLLELPTAPDPQRN